MTSQNYTYEIAVVLMFQNESRFLKEWIEYHKMIGVDHFYLCNNLSADDYFEIILPYLKTREVELFQYPSKTRTQAEYLKLQCKIYNEILEKARGTVKWLAFIDADEYIVPLEKWSLKEALEEFEPYGGIYLNWVNFGTSYVEKIAPDELRIEKLQLCQEHPIHLGKSIVQPDRTIDCTQPHSFYYSPPYYHVDSSFVPILGLPGFSDANLQIFHYYTGDLDHLINIKFPRRKRWVDLELKSYIEDLEVMNKKYNPLMQKYVPALKKRMGLNLETVFSS